MTSKRKKTAVNIIYKISYPLTNTFTHCGVGKKDNLEGHNEECKEARELFLDFGDGALLKSEHITKYSVPEVSHKDEVANDSDAGSDHGSEKDHCKTDDDIDICDSSPSFLGRRGRRNGLTSSFETLSPSLYLSQYSFITS